MMNFKRTAAFLVVVALAGAALALPATAKGKTKITGQGENMEPVAHIPWSAGTDMEVATIKGRDIAFASSVAAVAEGGGLHVIDVTNPEKSKEIGYAPCVLNQGDVQITYNRKNVLVSADGAAGPEGCLGVGKRGFMIYDIKNPAKPKPVGFADTSDSGGSHNSTAHPTKPYVYNSTSALAPPGDIQVWSIKNPAKPELVNTIPSLPHAPHDMAFNDDGTMMITAAISHWDLYDTTDPENPTLLWTGQCPGCTITHDAKFVPEMGGVIVGDEAGGGLTFPCPGGALYFYRLEMPGGRPVPVLTGAFEPHTLIFGQGTTPGSCTSHVFEISDDASHLAIAWYSSGVHYLNIGDLTGVAVGSHSAGNVKREAWFIPDGGSTWSAKLHNGPYMFTNDRTHGYIAYKIKKV